MTNVLRPDELTSQAKIKKSQATKNVIQGGATAIAGANILNKIMPFFNEYVPSNLALNGLKKVAPEIGKFLQAGQSMGLNLREGMDFVKNDLSKTNQQEPAKQSINIIQQYSPELYTFLDQEIKKGRSPVEAGAIAQNDKRFMDVIKKMMKDHKSKWSDILQTVFGAGEAMGQQQMQQPTQGQGSQALMGVLQQINQKLGMQ